MFSTLSVLIISIAAFLCCGIVASYKYPRTPVNPCELTHSPVLLAAQPATANEGALLAIPHTLALVRCLRCDMRYSYMIAGQWSLEELLLKQSRAVSEIGDLERMAQ